MHTSIKMRSKLSESIDIPEGVSCTVEEGILRCSRGSVTLSRNVYSPGIDVLAEGNKLVFSCASGNKNHFKEIMSLIAHARNIFSGLGSQFVYKLQACNVHFPMTLKVEKDRLLINNFLGEKKPRLASILPGVDVEVKGQSISVSSADKEAAGQTAANFEKATKVRCRDRRVFQDGIYIVEKGESQ